MKRPRPNQKTRRAKADRRRVPSRSELQQELTEVARHRAAISEVVRAIASSPHDLQPIFDTIIGSATHLCRANMGTLRLCEEEGRRLVARILHPNTLAERWSPPMFLQSGSLMALIANGLPVHVPDAELADLELQRVPGIPESVNLIGIRTFLVVPMLAEEGVIGTFFIGRARVQPFTDIEIELIMDFAAQAAIGLEIIRRERQYREVQMQLAHANRVATMGQLMASIAHELKQPLTAVVTSGNATSRWLKRDPPEIEEANQSVDRIIKETNRASDILERIHRLVKKDLPRADTLNNNDAIIEVIPLIQSEAVKDGVTVQTQLADHLPNIQGDRVQLQQVILNLIINAIQAMSGLTEGTRELHISTESSEEEGVRVALQDSGPGLSAETLQRLFEPFYTTKPNGMGMGLSICRSIIEVHGGRLWATGLHPNGALFQFAIPAS
jgi:C4-dicarboxylate-specific signal transduction histidine kinase